MPAPHHRNGLGEEHPQIEGRKRPPALAAYGLSVYLYYSRPDNSGRASTEYEIMASSSNDDAPRHMHGGAGTSGDAGGDDCDTAGPPLEVRTEPFGPDQQRIDQAITALLAHPHSK